MHPSPREEGGPQSGTGEGSLRDEFLSPLDHVLLRLQLAMVAGGEGLSRGAIQQVSRHPRELQEFARTAVAALRHFPQVQKPLFVL